MKRKTLSIIALLMALMLVVLTGCEKEVKRGNDDETEKTTVETKAETQEGEKEETDSVSEDETEAVGKDETDKPGKTDKADKSDKPATKDPVEKSEEISKEFFETSDDTGVSEERVDAIVDSVGSDDIAVEQDDEKIVKSGEFLFVAREVDANNVVTVMKYACKGDDVAVFVDSPEEKMGVIISGDVIYMVMTDEKVYVSIPKEFLGEEADSLTEGFDDAFIGEDDTEYKEYTETIDGVEYNVQEDEEGNKSYSIGKRLIKHVSTDGSVMYIDELTDIVPDSLFAPPADYTEMTLAEFAEYVG